MKFPVGQKVIVAGKHVGVIAAPLRQEVPNTDDVVWIFYPAKQDTILTSTGNVKAYCDYPFMRRVQVMKNDVPNYVLGKPYAQIEDFAGFFHGWGTELFEQQEGSTNYTVGIVELDDGSIRLAYPGNIRFL